MAITALGPLGTNNVKSAGADLTFSPSRDVPAGRFVVLWVAWDSWRNIALPSEGADQLFCLDSAGNIWCNVGAVNPSGPGDSSWAGLFVSQLRTDLLTTDVVTLGDGGDPGRIAKAMSAEEFDLGSGKRWALNRLGWSLSFNSVDEGQLSLMSVELDLTQEWLALHAVGNEGPDTDSFTWDADWTEIVGDGTTGSGDDSNVSIRGGYLIDTMGDASASGITNDTSDRDISQVMCGICAIDATEFPTTSVLDDFNRADENPLDNGDWDTTNSALNNFAQIGGMAVSAGGSLWAEDWEGCQEVFATISDYGGTVGLVMSAFGDAGAATLEGWCWQWATPRGVIFLSPVGVQGAAIEGWVAAWLSGADGTKMGMKRTYLSEASNVGATRAELDLDGEFEEVAALFVPGPSVARNGQVGITAAGGFLDDFGGGVIDCPRHRLPQIMRY